MRAIFLVCLFCFAVGCSQTPANQSELLNVSYDPTREFYADYNELFTRYWQEKTGESLLIRQSHGGSGKQARAVIQGLQADVVSLALALDIDEIAKQSKSLPEAWAARLPNQSVPFTSIVVFLVRKGNPKQIQDWDDLVEEDVRIITPNPKTSGGARWNYLAAYGYALTKNNHDPKAAEDYMRRLYLNVPILDTGARAAATTFTQRNLGDVLISWENEAYLVLKELGADDFEIIVPSQSIRADLPVAWVDAVIDRRGTRPLAEAYLRRLYLTEAQELGAKHFLRPTDPTVLEEHRQQFPDVPVLTIADFGGWEAAQKKHFSDGGLFDQIYSPTQSAID